MYKIYCEHFLNETKRKYSNLLYNLPTKKHGRVHCLETKEKSLQIA